MNCREHYAQGSVASGTTGLRVYHTMLHTARQRKQTSRPPCPAHCQQSAIFIVATNSEKSLPTVTVLAVESLGIRHNQRKIFQEMLWVLVLLTVRLACRPWRAPSERSVRRKKESARGRGLRKPDGVKEEAPTPALTQRRSVIDSGLIEQCVEVSACTHACAKHEAHGC